MNTTFEKDADKLEIPERNGGIRRTKVNLISMDWFKGNLQETIDFPIKYGAFL
jgi:hypothetical protein